MSRQMGFLGQAGVVVMVAVLGSGPALAVQTDATSRGFWIGLGFGAGQAGADCRGCADGTGGPGSTFFTGVAGGLSDRLVLGVEAHGWISGAGAFSPSDTGKTWRSALAAVIHYHPRPRPGPFLEAGLGVSSFTVSHPPLRQNAWGPGGLAGIGYDVRVSSALLLRPVLSVTVGFLGDVYQEDQFLWRTLVDRGVVQYVVKLDLGLMFHPPNGARRDGASP